MRHVTIVYNTYCAFVAKHTELSKSDMKELFETESIDFKI